MLFGIVAVIAAVLMSKGGFTEAIDSLARIEDPAASSTPGVFNSFFGPDPLGLLSVVILTSLGTWGLPQMVQKFYAIESEKAIHKGTIISTLFAIVVSGGCYFLGGFGRLFSDQINVETDGFDSIIPTMLSTLPDILIGLVVLLVLSASMSTLSSLVIASSSTLTLDFLKDTHNTRPDHTVHTDISCHRDNTVQEQHHIHRSAHGCILGCSGRFVPGSAPLRALLEKDDKSCLLVQLYMGLRSHDNESPFQEFIP